MRQKGPLHQKGLLHQKGPLHQKVVAVVPRHGSLFEIATPAGVWSAARTSEIGLNIDYVPCGLADSTVEIEGGMSLTGLGLLADHLADADMVVVPTWPIATQPVPPDLIDALLVAHDNGARLVGLCLGAFAIAATGLLDHQTAVTHWRFRDRFETANPNIRFEPNTLYIDHGNIVTSAGSAAAVDCCLHLVRLDHGAEAAAALARSLVTAPHRSGTQSQYAAAPPVQPGPDPLSKALADASEHIATIGSVDDLASLADASRRTLERQIRDRLGVTPKEWIDEQRVIAACRLLEQPNLSIEMVAQRAGYGSTPSLRRALSQHRGTTPTAYRAAFARHDE